MTKDEAIAKWKSGWYKNATYKEIVDFQLYEDLLCIPFDKFHEAMEKVLNRPIFTHEFADQKALQEEYEGKREYKGLLETIDRIVPKDKPVFIVTKE